MAPRTQERAAPTPGTSNTHANAAVMINNSGVGSGTDLAGEYVFIELRVL